MIYYIILLYHSILYNIFIEYTINIINYVIIYYITVVVYYSYKNKIKSMYTLFVYIVKKRIKKWITII
jgi:hypothetical protein